MTVDFPTGNADDSVNGQAQGATSCGLASRFAPFDALFETEGNAHVQVEATNDADLVQDDGSVAQDDLASSTRVLNGLVLQDEGARCHDTLKILGADKD
jgi:hypothetical protein